MHKTYIILVLALAILAGCTGKQGPEGKKSLIDLITEAPGANCATGGYKIVSGIDVNNNNILDANEIQTTDYICNGSNGSNSLASLVAEPPGPNCPTGGYKVNTGIDINNNNVLDASEIQNSQYLCNGLTGANSLVSLVAEPAGPNCSNGGYKINTGIDINNNGVLDAVEIKNVDYVCNGNNGLNYLIAVKAEPAGTNCTYGGYSFNTGIDVDKNGILDNNEITNTKYICNNAPSSEIKIPLDFPANTTHTTPVSGLALANFNKTNYWGMDSIVFAAQPYSGSLNNHAIADLIDMTNNVVLNGSQLSSNQPLSSNSIITTGNLYNAIPNTSINIGLRVRSENEGSFAAVYGTSYLILYHKN